VRSVELENIVSPVTSTDFADWLSLDNPADPNIIVLLEAATQKAMNFTGRAFLEQTITAQYDGYPGAGTSTLGLDVLQPIPYEWISLPYPKLISIESVTVEFPDGDVEAVTDYQVDVRSQPGRIRFKGQYPALNTKNFLVIEYKAGYGDVSDVPRGIKMGIMKIAGWSYEHRGDCDPATNPDLFRDLIPYRIMDRL
jgi:hypothetical protein